MMVNFYELNESEVISATGISAGSLICCKDSSNIYMVPTTGTTPVKMSDTIKMLTNSQREALLAPINGKLYFCYDTGKMWMYYNDWVLVTGDDTNSFDIDNVVLPTSGTVTVSDTRIKAGRSAEFVPDNSVADLVSDIAVTCANGSATITGTTSYSISGTLKVK